LAELNYHNAHYAAEKIASIPGFDLKYSQPFFNEFTVSCPLSVKELNSHLLEQDILGGYDLGHTYTDLVNHMLIAVTEMNSREEIDFLADVLAEVTNA
jgi:glycine dehydrogenase subunit 1